VVAPKAVESPKIAPKVLEAPEDVEDPKVEETP